MAFLNGKYTAFDPQITIEGVTDDDENCVVDVGTLTYMSSTERVQLSNMSKTKAEINYAVQNGKTVWFKYSAE